MAIGRNIKRIRKLKKQQVSSLAEKTGIKQESIYAWEREDYNPSEDNLQKIADALGVAVKDFYDDGEPAEVKTSSLQILQDALAEGSDYRVVPKTILDGEYRIIPYSELAMREKEFQERQSERLRTIEAQNKYIATLEMMVAELKSGALVTTSAQKAK